MKIVGILGSPRKGGNTETLLDKALGTAQEKGVVTDKIALRDKSIAPCDGCQACAETGRCVIEDDAQEIFQAFFDSDGIIWATPVYFWSMTSQTKILIDRTYALTFPKLQLASKVAGLILVAGSRGCMNTASVFHQYFSYNHMFVAEFVWGYASAKGEIKSNALATNMAVEMAHQMIGLIKAKPRYPEEFDAPIQRWVRKKYPM